MRSPGLHGTALGRAVIRMRAQLINVLTPRKSGSTSLRGYSGFRPDILRLLPPAPLRVLDIGCGQGGLGEGIKQHWPAAHVVGLDGNQELLADAATRLDEALLADLNAPTSLEVLGVKLFDVIILADVLEHLVAPEQLLRGAVSHLTPNGVIITSLPNVRHYSTLIALVFSGRWPRRGRGIHDRTHLHFYTRKDILDLLRSCGLTPVREARNVRLVESLSWTNIPGKLLDFWPFRGFLTFQYLHLSRPSTRLVHP